MYTNLKKLISKFCFLVVLIVYHGKVYSQTAKVYKSSELDSSFFNRPYSMIISNGDTLFSARLVEGHEIPKFNKKVFGFYIEINKKKVIRKSFVYKGRLTGYYVRYNGKEIVEQGYFYKGLRRILD